MSIHTEFICPPIPDRSHDWYARFSIDDGDTDLTGFGETEADAVLTLLINAVEYDGDGSQQEDVVDMAFKFWKSERETP